MNSRDIKDIILKQLIFGRYHVLTADHEEQYKHAEDDGIVHAFNHAWDYQQFEITALRSRIEEIQQYLLGAQKLIQELYSVPITFQEIREIIRQKNSNITVEF